MRRNLTEFSDTLFVFVADPNFAEKDKLSYVMAQLSCGIPENSNFKRNLLTGEDLPAEILNTEIFQQFLNTPTPDFCSKFIDNITSLVQHNIQLIVLVSKNDQCSFIQELKQHRGPNGIGDNVHFNFVFLDDPQVVEDNSLQILINDIDPAQDIPPDSLVNAINTFANNILTTLPNVIPADSQTNPPSTDPPSTNPPSTNPPSTDPPSTDPPSTNPPSTNPPSTDPPSTDPPTTDPPSTDLPSTDLPSTDPPSTDPPSTNPPPIDPPSTDPPSTNPPPINPPDKPVPPPHDHHHHHHHHDEDLEPWMIAVIVATVVILGVFVCVGTLCIRRKLEKQKKEQWKGLGACSAEYELPKHKKVNKLTKSPLPPSTASPTSYSGLLEVTKLNKEKSAKTKSTLSYSITLESVKSKKKKGGSKETMSKKSGSRETVPKKGGSRESVSKKGGSRESVSKKGGSRESGSKEGGSKENGSREPVLNPVAEKAEKTRMKTAEEPSKHKTSIITV